MVAVKAKGSDSFSVKFGKGHLRNCANGIE